MPREKIEDKTTPGLFTQVSWRKHDEVPGFDAPGHVQVATINERGDALVAQLLDEAATLVALLSSSVRSGELLTDEDEERLDAWRKSLKEHRPELTGWYAQHDDEDVSALIRTLHKARSQAFDQNGVASTSESATIEVGRRGRRRRFPWFDKPGQLD